MSSKTAFIAAAYVYYHYGELMGREKWEAGGYFDYTPDTFLHPILRKNHRPSNNLGGGLFIA
ncbi:hypothetical protein [Peribacillus frigoritolerans]|uniref:hypothetical protein n=1 Tax=Peribacillus frigoritolerans TaxID=450367 RepID=UPI0033061066